MARRSGTAAARGVDGGKGGRGARQGKDGSKAPTASPIRRVRMGGQTVYVHEATFQTDKDPASVDDSYEIMPGGGDQAAEDLLEEAGAFTMRGDYKEASRRYKAVLARFPNHYMANNNMGVNLRLEGKPLSAIKYFRRAIMAWPEQHVAYSGMGRTLLDMKRYDEALGMLEKALEIQPDDPMTLKARNKALRALGKKGRR